MPDLDEFLRNELRRTVKTVDVTEVSSRIDARRTYRAKTRKVQGVALAVVVIAGSLGGVAVLRSVFSEPGPGVGPVSGVENGLIVYSEVRNAGQHLWVVNTDGSGARQLTTDAGVSDTAPALSPDGRTVAFVRISPIGLGIFAIGIDGAGLTRLTPASMSVSEPAWSPDGMRIAFAGDDGGIYVMSLAGRDPRLIVDRTFVDSQLTWSPDGSKIAFSARPVSTGPEGNYDLWITDVEGVTQINITGTPADNELSPSWSPDGRRILFAKIPASGASSLSTIEPDPDATPVPLTDGANLDQNPSWAPDGSRIVFDRASAAGTDVYTMRPDGSDLTLVARNAIDPAWQPLGSDQTGSPSPSTGPADVLGLDVGLDFRLCGANRLSGIDILGDGTAGSAWTGVRLKPDGTCPSEFDGFNVVAVDHTGDGIADSWWGPMQYCVGCRPFDATDLNADGAEELVVLAQWGTTPQYLLFSMETGPGGEPRVRPILIATPGHPQAGFRPGDPVALWAGGDEGFTGSVRCEGYPDTPILVATWSDHPVDGPGSETKEVHETRLRLEADGLMHVVDSSDSTQPTTDPGPETWTGQACGVHFWPTS
jgi:Tol biopolymer transport system component